MIRPAGRAGRLVAFHLLEHPDEAISSRAIAERTGLAFASVNDILRFFRFHGALSEAPPSRVRWKRLAELTSSLRLPDIVPVRSVHVNVELEDITHRLMETGTDHAFAFTTAANRWAYFEPDPATHLVVGSRRSKKAAGEIASDRPPRHPKQVVYIYEDDLTALRTEVFGNLTLTSRLQTWIDLQVFPHAAAHAAFFKQVIEKTHPEKRPHESSGTVRPVTHRTNCSA